MTSLKELQKLWQQHGDTDPMWAVLAEKEKKGNRWDPNEFFATGAGQIDQLLADGRQLGFPLEHRTALDFGCGVGRLTQALATRFSSATGIDIAASMIEQAKEHNRHANCTYLLNSAGNLRLFSDNSFDFVVSVIVLQHMEPRYSRQYIREFVRVLAPGGLLVFQVPSHLTAPRRRRLLDPIHERTPRPLLKVYRSAKKVLLGIPPPDWEMHGLICSEVEAVIADSGGLLLRCSPTTAAGEAWIDFFYYVTKPRVD